MLGGFINHNQPLAKPIQREHLPPASKILEQIVISDQLNYYNREPEYTDFLTVFENDLMRLGEEETVAAPYFRFLARIYWLSMLAEGEDINVFNPATYKGAQKRCLDYEFCLEDWCSEEVCWHLLLLVQTRTYREIDPDAADGIIRELCYLISVYSTELSVSTNHPPRNILEALHEQGRRLFPDTDQPAQPEVHSPEGE